jgi:hypothetical protein
MKKAVPKTFHENFFDRLFDYKTPDGRRIDPSAEHNSLLTEAIHCYASGRSDVSLRMIRRLLKDSRVNPADSGNEDLGIPSVLEQALHERLYDVAHLLLLDPRVRIHDVPGKLTDAIEQNDVRLVQFLTTLPLVISKEHLRRAFQLANDIQDRNSVRLPRHFIIHLIIKTRLFHKKPYQKLFMKKYFSYSLDNEVIKQTRKIFIYKRSK